MARAIHLVRPAAVLSATLLVAGLVQAGPAAAAPVEGPAISVSVYPSPELPISPGLGDSPDHPADLGRIPGAVGLYVRVSNTGTEPLHSLTAVNELVANGKASGPGCDFSSPEPRQRTAVDDDAVLEPGRSVLCHLAVTDVMDGGLHEDITTVTGRGVDSGIEVSDDIHFYATAEDDSVKVGDRVWLDTDRDGVQDEGEPGIGGVDLTITGPDGAPVPDMIDRDQVVGPQTTASDGSYLFKHLGPLPWGDRYTVTVDQRSPALRDLLPTLAGVGSPLTDSSTGSGQSVESLDSTGTGDRSVDFGFVTQQAPPVEPPVPAKAPIALTVSAPSSAVTGSVVTVKGTVKREGKAYKTSAVLEFQADGSVSYGKLKTVKSSSKGALSTSVKPSRSGSYRYRFAGNATTVAGVSAGDHVDVRKATVKLTVNAPGSVTKGKSVKVKGSVKREGKGWKTSTVLEFKADGGSSYAKVKTVKSSSKGALTTSLKPSRSGSYRYRFAGSSTTSAGASGGDRLVVKPKPPSKPKPKEYKNCTALVKVYPHGVGRSGAEDKGGDVTDFTRDTTTYNLNTKSDRDKDGIACER